MMAKVVIDGREYESENLGEGARLQLANISVVDEEIRRLQNQIAICQTARIAYVAALQAALPPSQ
jgi:hypothetical protein